MCGIAGVLSFGSHGVDAGELALLAQALSHRGPDGSGSWLSADRRIGIVHTRLAIIDTSSGGHQPMQDNDGSLVVAFNGEIYNFLELRAELKQLGAEFRTESDTEVILAAWKHWNTSMFHRFNGMWAIALHDASSGRLVLARDRFGVKPLLIAKAGKLMAFASEVNALIRLPWVSREPDPDACASLLFDPFSIESGERTLLRNVQRIPAGHFALVGQDGSMQVHRWWRTLDFVAPIEGSFTSQVEQFRRLFLDAIRLRMRSDVPIGSSLSGGFDSSSIVCSISHLGAADRPSEREANEWRHAFIAGFPGEPHDETRDALTVARYAGMNPHVVQFDDRHAEAEIERVLQDLDDVYLGLPTAPWQVYRHIRESGVRVTLEGHGADELMGGYRQAGNPLGFWLRNSVDGVSSAIGGAAHLMSVAKACYLRAKGLNYLRDRSAPMRLPTPFDGDVLPAGWSAFDRRLYRMFHVSVLPTILRNFDRLSMAHGIEVRMPYMDWKLVTFVMSLGASAKYRNGLTKAIAREAMAGLMPESIRVNPRKVGYNSPMPAWLNGPLSGWVQDVLSKPSPVFHAIVDTTALGSRVRQLSESRAWDWSAAGRLWPYINMNWYLNRLSGHV